MKFRASLEKYKEPICYLFWGTATTAVNYGVYFLCKEVLALYYILGQALAWAASVLFAFCVNKPFVFDSKSWEPSIAIPELFKFVGARLFSGVLETALLWMLVELFQFPDGIVKLAVSIVTVILNYIFSKWFIFHRRNPHE